MTSTAVSSDSAPHSPADAVVDVIRREIETEIAAACKDWRCMKRLASEHHRAPKVVRVQTKVVEVIPCSVFTKCCAVCAQTVVEAAVPCPRRRRDDGTDVDADSQTFTGVFETLHFSHLDDAESGYEVQSVWGVPETSYAVHPLHTQVAPLVTSGLQCYTEAVVQMATLCLVRLAYGSCPGRGEGWDLATIAATFPFAPISRREDTTNDCSAVVLGMGGNVVGRHLQDSWRPRNVFAHIGVVEIEPSVVAICERRGRLVGPGGSTRVFVGDVEAGLDSLLNAAVSNVDEKNVVSVPSPRRHVPLIVLDCFDPHQADMMAHRQWLVAIRSSLSPPDSETKGGVMVVNVLFKPTADHLRLFHEVFGEGCVEVLELTSNHPPQIIIACTTAPMPVVATAASMNLLALTCERIVSKATHDDGEDLSSPIDAGRRSSLFPVSPWTGGYRTVHWGDENGEASQRCTVRIWKNCLK